MKIGVFDSGIGGMTVLRALREAWPGHSTLYLGDTARVPYGTKSAETVRRYARQVTRYLIDEGAELVVVACNTASAYAMDDLRAALPVPVVGVIEPGAAEAVAATRSGVIGVIGTAATVRSGAYESAIHALRGGAVVVSRACPLFVPLADEGWEDSEVARLTAMQYLAGWLPGGGGAESRSAPPPPDVVVLGCTHYPVFKPLLAGLLGPGVTLVDSARAMARAVEPILAPAAAETSPAHRLVVTDGAEGFARTAHRFLGLGDKAELEVVDLSPRVGD